MGFGLIISCEYVWMMGGELVVVFEFGKGLSFSFVIIVFIGKFVGVKVVIGCVIGIVLLDYG